MISRYDMIWYDMIWYDMIWYDMIWYDMIKYDKQIWCDMIWYDMIKYDKQIWCDMIWYDMIWYDKMSKADMISWSYNMTLLIHCIHLIGAGLPKSCFQALCKILAQVGSPVLFRWMETCTNFPQILNAPEDRFVWRSPSRYHCTLLTECQKSLLGVQLAMAFDQWLQECQTLFAIAAKALSGVSDDKQVLQRPNSRV